MRKQQRSNSSSTLASARALLTPAWSSASTVAYPTLLALSPASNSVSTTVTTAARLLSCSHTPAPTLP
jgi:hypothetical protein